MTEQADDGNWNVDETVNNTLKLEKGTIEAWTGNRCPDKECYFTSNDLADIKGEMDEISKDTYVKFTYYHTMRFSNIQSAKIHVIGKYTKRHLAGDDDKRDDVDKSWLKGWIGSSNGYIVIKDALYQKEGEDEWSDAGSLLSSNTLKVAENDRYWVDRIVKGTLKTTDKAEYENNARSEQESDVVEEKGPEVEKGPESSLKSSGYLSDYLTDNDSKELAKKYFKEKFMEKDFPNIDLDSNYIDVDTSKDITNIKKHLQQITKLEDHFVKYQAIYTGIFGTTQNDITAKQGKRLFKLSQEQKDYSYGVKKAVTGSNSNKLKEAGIIECVKSAYEYFKIDPQLITKNILSSPDQRDFLKSAVITSNIDIDLIKGSILVGFGYEKLTARDNVRPVFLTKNGELTDGYKTNSIARSFGSAKFTLYKYHETVTDGSKKYLTFVSTLSRVFGKTKKLAAKLAPSNVVGKLGSTIGTGVKTLASTGMSMGRTIGRNTGLSKGGKRRTLKKRSKK